MVSSPVIIVCLRRPQRSDPNETRADPFWEFGSFGCTKCHSGNLMNPKRLDELVGARLAFAQGGPSGFRLVHLTPPVVVSKRKFCNQLLWSPQEMPYRYDCAPCLIDNGGRTRFPALRRFLRGVNRSTWEGRLSSKFRSNRSPLPPRVGAQICERFDADRRASSRREISTRYDQAVPWPPPTVDTNRRATYLRLSDQSSARAKGTSCARGKSCCEPSLNGRRKSE